ncbi:hypothetical protein CDL12_29561 [Handroanthus impetiginosus]|uniref:Uncharacterized protein n=1 Tax=Handroanthus impetiginosus TaxID=429701 RepID=A0A2G9FYJ5_9LAMI|nr:hypothetical protein CDL12_29561 [Handroanthus impetiginosus]
MEGLREIAAAYYERSNDNEKEAAEEFFRKTRLKQRWQSKPYRTEKVGSCVLYGKKVKLLVCSGCCGLLVGPYFSCLLCLGKGNDSFDLCCSCCRRGSVSHEHSDKYLLDYHSLLSETKW